jgi:hypothetical protein
MLKCGFQMQLDQELMAAPLRAARPLDLIDRLFEAARVLSLTASISAMCHS